MFEHAVYTVATRSLCRHSLERCQQGSPSRNCPKNHCLGSQNLGILDHLLRNLGGAHSDPQGSNNSQAGAAAELG